jgi:hypothetical protein
LSSASQSPGSGEVIVIFLFLIILFAFRRVHRSYRGMRFSAARTIAYAVFYVAFGSIFSILSFFDGVSVVWALPYVALMAGASFWSYRYSDRRISFWSGGDGSVYFKGGVILYLIYIAGLIGRLSIDVIFLGPNFFVIDPNEVLSSTALSATIATDLLLMFGLGLLIGRNARVMTRYRKIEQGKEPLPDSPPAYQPIFGSGRGGLAT